MFVCYEITTGTKGDSVGIYSLTWVPNRVTPDELRLNYCEWGSNPGFPKYEPNIYFFHHFS